MNEQEIKNITDSTVENTGETGDINAQSFYTLIKKKEIDAPSFLQLLADF